MTRAAQHLDYTPGLVDGYCGPCTHLFSLHAKTGCAAYDKVLKVEDARPRRCAECLRGNRPDEGND